MLDNTNLFESRNDNEVTLDLENGYTYTISLDEPKFTFCHGCLEPDVFHIEDGVCFLCGFSDSEILD